MSNKEISHLVNLTPDLINIEISGEESVLAIEPDGMVARITQKDANIGQDTSFDYKGIEVQLRKALGGEIVAHAEGFGNEGYDNSIGEEQLPEEIEGRMYITSSIVMEEAVHQGRTDVVSPDTVRATRGDRSVPGLYRIASRSALGGN